MAGLVRMSLDSPEETVRFAGDAGQVDLVNLAGSGVGRATYLPGWRWSVNMKPVAQTDSCQANHVGYIVAGRMKVVMNDGDEAEFVPGDFAVIPPGHDAWVVGDDACVFVDWGAFAGWGRR